MIKAIETSYKGFRFRSRLEARFAVFFDSLGVKWEYEPEGYALDDGRCYLPDFFLPDLVCWFEIKPTYPDREATQKMLDLCLGTAKSGVIAYGGVAQDHMLMFSNDIAENSAGSGTSDYAGWFVCGRCGNAFIHPGFYDREFYHDSDFDNPYVYCGCGNAEYGYIDPVQPAIVAARAARFEHGERPR